MLSRFILNIRLQPEAPDEAGAAILTTYVLSADPYFDPMGTMTTDESDTMALVLFTLAPERYTNNAQPDRKLFIRAKSVP